MQDIINRLEKIFENSTGIHTTFSNKNILHLKFSINSLPHCFGIQEIQRYIKLSPGDILDKIKKNEINIEKIRKNLTIKKDDRATIYNKIECINVFLNLKINDINNIFLFKDINFEKYSVDYVLLYKKYLLCFNSSIKNSKSDPNFDSVYIMSIRKITNDKQLKNFLTENNHITYMEK